MFAMRVWTYSGHMVSDIYQDLFTVPSVLVIHEYRHHYEATFMFFFQNQWITLNDQVVKVGSRTYYGYTKDSRGYDIDWRFQISGDEINGSYNMDFDRGVLQLNLVSLQKSEAKRSDVIKTALSM